MSCDALLPAGGDLGGRRSESIPGWWRLQVPPEQPAQGVGQTDRVVWSTPAGVPAGSRPADHGPVGTRYRAVDELLHASWPLVGTTPGRSARGVAAATRRARAAAGRSTGSCGWRTCRRRRRLEQLQAVADGDVGDAPPLAARMTAIRCKATAGGGFPDRIGPASRGSSANPTGSRVRAISAASRFGVAVVSSQARPGRITSAHINDNRPVPSTCGVEPAVDDGWPCATGSGRSQSTRPSVLGAAGQPPLLPGVTRLGLQPVHDEPTPPARRCSSPRRGDGAVRAARTTRSGGRCRHSRGGHVGRERGLPQSWRAVGVCRGRSPSRLRSRPRPRASAAASRSVPNKTFNDSGRYPAAPGGGAGC